MKLVEIRDTLLIVCGREAYRDALSTTFEKSYNLLKADNQQQAVRLMERNYACIAAVLVDIDGPDSANFQLLQKMRDHTVFSQLPAIVTLDDSARAAEGKLLELGAADVVSQGCDAAVLHRRVLNIVRLFRSKWQMQELVEAQARLLFNANESMVDALSSIIEYRSAETGQHIVRIRHFTQVLLEEVARSCPEYSLTPRKISLIASAAALHDIGKIAIPDSILNKPGRLSAEEWRVMETHPIIGCQMIQTLCDSVNTEYLRYAHNICRYHHEQWDGRGYPEGLSGDEIPICAQVVSLADVYDALTSRRIYKEAYDTQRAVDIIMENQCGKFSPKLIACFARVRDAFAQLVVRYSDAQTLNEESHDLERQRQSLDPGMDALARAQMKYQRLLHYIDATIIEMDLENNRYRMVYSPDPELSMLAAGHVGVDGVHDLLMQMASPEEQQEIVRMVSVQIDQLFEKGLNRCGFQISMRAPEREERYTYDVTLLRENMIERERRSLIIICKRVENADASETKNDFCRNQIAGSYCCRVDDELTLSGSSRVAEILGYTGGEFEARMCWSLAQAIVPEERAGVLDKLRAQLKNGPDAQIECSMLARDGRKIRVMTHCRRMVHADGMEYLHGVMVDVSRSARTQEDLNSNLDLLHIILNQTDNVIFEWDVRSDAITYSRHAQDLFGFEPIREHARERIHETHIHPDDREIVQKQLRRFEAGQEYHEIEVRIALADGKYRWYRFRATGIFGASGKPERMVGIIINIDKEKRAAQALLEQAERDALTRLLNKDVGRRRAEEKLMQAQSGEHYALMIIDLDNFKHINDRYGHMFGDAVLARTAAVIADHFGADDVVSRIGGDEFLALMRCDEQGGMALARCKALQESLRSVFSSLVNEERLSCSVGVAIYPEHARQYTELFQRADQALYRVKDVGKDSFAVYDVKDPEPLRGRSRITTVNERIESDEQPGLADDGIVRYALRRLHESGDAHSTINELLALVGQQMNVSRVYIFENSADGRLCSNTFEWCNTGISPEKDTLQNISYENELAGYEYNFDEQGVFYCEDVSVLPLSVYNIVQPQGIKSMLQCAIRDKGRFLGYVGFDECAAERKWTKEQISVLSFFSQVLSVFLLKVRAQNEISDHAQDLASVLDSQSNHIYVIDPQSCELRFANQSARQCAQRVTPDARCYEVLMGRSERCAECPALRIQGQKGYTLRLENKLLADQPRAEVSPITWRGKDACLIVCYKKENAPDAQDVQ